MQSQVIDAGHRFGSAFDEFTECNEDINAVTLALLERFVCLTSLEERIEAIKARHLRDLTAEHNGLNKTRFFNQESRAAELAKLLVADKEYTDAFSLYKSVKRDYEHLTLSLNQLLNKRSEIKLAIESLKIVHSEDT